MHESKKALREAGRRREGKELGKSGKEEEAYEEKQVEKKKKRKGKSKQGMQKREKAERKRACTKKRQRIPLDLMAYFPNLEIFSDPRKENWKDVIPHVPNVRINSV